MESEKFMILCKKTEKLLSQCGQESGTTQQGCFLFIHAGQWIPAFAGMTRESA